MRKNKTQLNTSDQEPKTDLLVFVFRLSLIAALGAFFIFVASKSYYFEPGILLVGAISGLMVFVLFWKSPLTVFQYVAVLLLIVMCLITGLWAIGYGRYNSQVNSAQAKGVILEAAAMLSDMKKKDIALPIGPWGKAYLEINKNYGPFEITLEDETGRTVKVLKKLPRKDGWGCKYIYENLGESGFLLQSSGRDLKLNTRDDLMYLSGASPPQVPPLAPVAPGFFQATRVGMKKLTGF